MEAFVKEFEHLRIQLEDIKSATANFNKAKVIGCGGFGKVYKGEVTHSTGRNLVAIKRLDRKHGQGDIEFWREITLLSRYTHKNLISLLGFCDESDEKILVYEHALNGSLDRHLRSMTLTWSQRIQICLDAARGLCYLHDDKGTFQRVIHRDIKSANILLDEKWSAKVSDMGLSKLGPANQQHTALVTNVAGTTGYCDPLYMEQYILTKESDVYSFGVVLFEVLCGRLCSENRNGKYQILAPYWKEIYAKNKLDDIIFHGLETPMDSSSLASFSDIAYECLKTSRVERPDMFTVVAKLEVALEYQQLYESGVKLPKSYKEMIKTAVPPLSYRSEGELKKLFFEGILLNWGKTWFSLNMKEEHSEMISIAECLTPIASESETYIYSSEYDSRFAVGSYEPKRQVFKTHVRAQFLSPLITYTVNLVLKDKAPDEQYIGLEYKLEGGPTSYSFLSDEREDGWSSVELFQFTSEKSDADLKILFDIEHCRNILVDGIEFQPLETVKRKVLNDEKVDLQPISDSDTDWEHKLPNNYKDIVKLSKHGVTWTTEKELYRILCKGFLINAGEEWFSLAKDGKKCLMLSARATLDVDKWRWKFLPKTRFEVAHHPSPKFHISFEIESGLLSPQTTYACFLVYKQEGNYRLQPPPARVKDKSSHSGETCHIYLRSPQTPVIIKGKVDEKSHSPMNRPRIKGLPQRRSDGWMEVQIWEFRTTTKMICMRLKLSSYDETLKGIKVQGVEFRPV